MSLESGARLGPYEVLATVGAGGMGEVYRARDPRLGRDVAIKVLPAAFSTDPERLRRFEQEARAAAALNHPNILAVYDIGQHDGSPHIVAEMLDGETLRQKIAAGPLPVRRAVEYAVQIARGLEAAHERGIVHRDLKPENIFVAAGDRVKILDFGLAKLVEPMSAVAAVSDIATSPPDTVPGIIVGTLGYMAPEQVRGMTADHRADIFAFGAVLYEMLSGHRAFRGSTPIDTMTAILKEDPPDLADAHRNLPPALVKIVDRCLAKSVAARFQSAADLAFALDALSTQSGATEAVRALPWRDGRTLVGWGIAASIAIVVAAAVGAALYYTRRVPSDAPVYRTSINIPPGVQAAALPPSGLALSPDGRRLVFSAVGSDSRRLLWMRTVDGTTAQPLPGTDNGQYPFWSPDSRFVGFTAAGQLKKIDVSGGPAVTVAEAPGGLDGSWGPDGTILFFARISGKQLIWRVPSAGGTPVPATTLDESSADNRHVAPFFLPDGRHFLYLAVGSKAGGANDPRAVYVGSLDASEPAKMLLQGGSNAKYGGGYLWFIRGQTLMAQPFDQARLALEGEPVPIAEELAVGGQTGQIGAFSISETGVLAYVMPAPIETSQLAWFDRAGAQTSALGDPGDYGDVELAPDGTRAVVSVLDAARRPSRDLWVYDVRRSFRTRFTFDVAAESWAVWSPDGSRIIFSSNRQGLNFDMYEKESSGGGAETVILADASSEGASSWSHDGRLILYSAGPLPNQRNLWVLPTAGDRKPSPFIQSEFDMYAAQFSPDGRWVAYVSDESSRDEVYITPFPGTGGKWQVSRTGGSWPRWRRDGKELFYLAPNNVLMAAAINGQGAALEVGSVTPLFQTRARRDQRSPYDVSADGQRFLINSFGESGSAPVTLVVNWPALLKR